jgi:hypothetical protein
MRVSKKSSPSNSMPQCASAPLRTASLLQRRAGLACGAAGVGAAAGGAVVGAAPAAPACGRGQHAAVRCVRDGLNSQKAAGSRQPAPNNQSAQTPGGSGAATVALCAAPAASLLSPKAVAPTGGRAAPHLHRAGLGEQRPKHGGCWGGREAYSCVRRQVPATGGENVQTRRLTPVQAGCWPCWACGPSCARACPIRRTVHSSAPPHPLLSTNVLAGCPGRGRSSPTRRSTEMLPVELRLAWER